jgi:hypothetical protein
LTTCHTVVEVIENKKGEVKISSAGGKDMGATNTEATVSHDYNDVQLRLCHFQTGGVCECPAVQTMEGMAGEKGVEQSRTSYVGDEYKLVSSNLEML